MSIRFGKLTRHPSQTANFANQTEIFGHSLFQHVICKANPEPNPFSLCLQSKTVLQLRSVERFATLFFFETFGWMQPQHPRRNITVICAMFGMEIYFSYDVLRVLGPNLEPCDRSIWPKCFAQLWWPVLQLTVESQLCKRKGIERLTHLLYRSLADFGWRAIKKHSTRPKNSLFTCAWWCEREKCVWEGAHGERQTKQQKHAISARRRQLCTVP